MREQRSVVHPPPSFPARPQRCLGQHGAGRSALGRVQFDQVLQLRGVASDGAALVSLHVAVHAAVAEDEARRGQGGGVDPDFAAQRAQCLQLG